MAEANARVRMGERSVRNEGSLLPLCLRALGERARLLARVREAAEALKARFEVRRVVLFGSLAHAAWFVPDSDTSTELSASVDLAVEGLAGADYWEAWRLVEEVIGDRPVDLIEIERAGESLRRTIERYGVEHGELSRTNMGAVAEVLIQRFPSLRSGQALAIIEDYAPSAKRLRPYQTLVLAVDRHEKFGYGKPCERLFHGGAVPVGAGGHHPHHPRRIAGG